MVLSPHSVQCSLFIQFHNIDSLSFRVKASVTTLCLFLCVFLFTMKQRFRPGRCLTAGVVLICLECELCGTRSEGEKAPWKPTHFKGLLLVLLSCERNCWGFLSIVQQMRLILVIEWPYAYEGIGLALMWHLCSESVNCSDGWPGG